MMDFVLDILSELSTLTVTLLNYASPLEILWSFGACIGIYFAGRSCNRAVPQIVRLWSVRKDKWPIFNRSIKRLRDALGVLLRQTGWLTIGMMAMSLPQATSPDPDANVAPGVVTATVLIVLEIYDILALCFDERDWKRTVFAFTQDPTLILKLIESDLPDSLREATGAGRDMAHIINNQIFIAMGTVSMMLETYDMPDDIRIELTELLANLEIGMEKMKPYHQRLRDLSPREVPK